MITTSRAAYFEKKQKRYARRGGLGRGYPKNPMGDGVWTVRRRKSTYSRWKGRSRKGKFSLGTRKKLVQKSTMKRGELT